MEQALDAFFELSSIPVTVFKKWAESLKPSAIADRIGYKCHSAEEFERIRRSFEQESCFIYQSIISGRRIAVIRMKRVIATPLGEICFLELSDQKHDGRQQS